ncbi:hypothetical protein DOTSEDRAFT_47898 [Lecanosticta acicola]|uniref:Dienelactone hydrolase domain-containing protein n=1 Tax=Lecanosticta acicola TaxID=111012 RepID=A0AAI9EAW8_9PEZI|nr:hypothetical protein DOTSEDRAFT_47898 [Lecanosticta acicola]
MAISGVGMSACCLSGKLAQGTPTGREEKVGGVDTYIAEPQGGSKSKTVVFLVDIFGWKLPNVRLLADNYAKAGFYAYIPDAHTGDSLPSAFLDTVEPPLPKRETLTVVDKAAATAQVGATLGPWLLKHREGVARPLIENFISHVRSLPGTQKVGALGFCWGGRYAILAAQAPFSGVAGRGVDAAFACHPSLVAIPGDFEPVVAPLGLAVGDQDSLLSKEQDEQIAEVFEKKAKGEQGDRMVGGIGGFEMKIYEGQVHGFALRGDWSSARDQRAMDDAEQQGIAWFNRFLS